MGVVVVVGGAGDIGREIVRRFTREGWRVAVWDVQEVDSNDQAPDLVLSCDITDGSAVQSAITMTEEKLGRVRTTGNNVHQTTDQR